MVNHWRFPGLGTYPSKTPVANEQQVIIITRDTSKLDQSLLKNPDIELSV